MAPPEHVERESESAAEEGVGALLAHEPFLQRVARRLVRDPAEADDLVQETWVASLENPPPADRLRARPWLARVARNLAINRFRRRARRSLEALDEERAGTTGAAAEIVAAGSVQQALQDALRTLPEAYRVPIVLAYYDALPPRAIAKRLGLPVETVRTRIKRGLGRLRDELDRRSGGKRGEWLGALLAWLPRESPAPRVARLAQLAAIGAGAFGLLAGLWLVRAGGGEREPESTSATAAALERERDPRAGGLADERRGVPSAPAREPVAAQVASAPAELAPLDPRDSLLAGRLVDERGEPVRHGEVLVFEGVEPIATSEGWPTPVRTTSTDAEGRFELAGLARPFFALARSGPRVSQGLLRAEPESAAELRGVELVLAPARTLEGVVRDEDGRPLVGCEVRVQGGTSRRTTVRSTGLRGAVWVDQIGAVAHTDEHGRFRLAELARGVATLTFRHPEHPPLDLDLDPASAELEPPLEVVLARGAVLALHLEDARGAPAAGATVRFLVERETATVLETRALVTDGDGRCRLPPAAAGGRTTLRIDLAGSASRVCVVEALEDCGEIALALPATRELRGLARGPDGAPLGACQIDILWSGLDTRDVLARRALARLTSATTAADGSFALTGLPDVELVAELRSPASSYAAVHAVPAGVEAVELRPSTLDGVVSGRALDAALGRALGTAEGARVHAFERTGERRTAEVEVSAGEYALALPPGEWWLCAEARGYAPRVLVLAVPVAGSIDLHLHAERTLTVRVEDRHGRPWASGWLVIDDEEGQRWPVWKRPGISKNSVALGPAGDAALAGLPAKRVRLTLFLGELRAPLTRVVDLTRAASPLTWTLAVDGAEERVPVRIELRRETARGTDWYEGAGDVSVRDAQGELVLAWSFHARPERCEVHLGPSGLSLDHDEGSGILHVRERPSSIDWPTSKAAGAEARRVPAFESALPPGTYRVELRAPGFAETPSTFEIRAGAAPTPWVVVSAPSPEALR